MIESDIGAIITNMLAAKSARRLSPIVGDFELLRDFALDGDDAAEVMAWFADRFQVDMRDFDFVRHFRSEPNLFSILKLPSKKRVELEATIPIKVFDLIRAAEVHRWVSPVTPSGSISAEQA